MSKNVYEYICSLGVASAAEMTFAQKVKLSTIALKEQAAAFFASPWGIATGVVIGIYAIAKAVEYFNGAADRARENLVESRNEYNNTVTELTNLRSELETVQARMEELDGKTLTITEAEELQNLQAQNAEIQRQIDLLNLQKKLQQQEVNSDFVKTMNADMNRRDQAVSSSWDVINSYNNTGSVDAMLITEEEYIQRQFDEYHANLDRLHALDEQYKDDLSNKQYLSQRKRIEENNTKILTYLSDKNAQFTEDTEGISYIPDPETTAEENTNKWLDYINDFQDRLAIVSGGDNAKTNAFNRLINGEFDEATTQLQELGAQGKVTAADLNDPAYADFLQKLMYLGVITDTTDESLAFVAAGFNSLATAEAVAAAGTRDFKSVMTSVTEGLDNVQERVSTLSGALSSLQDGTLTATEVVDLLQQFPELAPYVDLTADGFGNLNDGLKELIKNTPTKLIETLEDFKRTNDLTDEAAESVDDLIDYLTDMPVDAVKDLGDEFGLMEKAVNGANQALADLEKILSGSDYDDNYNSRVEYFEKLQEMLKNGEVGSKHYKALTDYFGLSDMSADEVKKWAKQYKGWFTENNTGIQKFLANVKKLSAEGGELDGIMDYDGKSFSFDATKLDEAAEILGIDVDLLSDLIQKVRSLSETWDYSTEGMFNELTLEGLTRELNDGTLVANLDDIMMYLEMTADEARAFVDDVNSTGLADLRIVDDAALQDWAGFADSTNRTAAEIQALSDALEAAGMSSRDINNFVNGNWAQLKANFDTVLKPFLEDLQWSQEEIDELYSKMTNMHVASEGEENLSETTVKLMVDGEEVDTAIETVGQLNQALLDLPDDTTLTVIDDTGEARSGLYKTDELLKEIANNKYQKIIIEYEATGTPPVNYGANENRDNNIQHNATGTAHATEGLSLLGDEYSPDGSPKPELVVSDGYAYIAGESGPEMGYLNDGDRVYTADQTERILNSVNDKKKVIQAHYMGANNDSSFLGSVIPHDDKKLEEDMKKRAREAARRNVAEALVEAGHQIEAGSSNITMKPSTKSGSSSKKSSGGSSGSSSKSESEFEKLYKKHQHLVNMEQETDQEYLDWLADAYKEAYKKGQIELDDFYKYEEEVFNLRREIFSDSLNDIEHQIKALENSDGSPSAIVALYDDMVKKIEKQLAAAYKSGLDDNDSYVQELQSQLWDYQSEVKDIQEEITENAEDAIEELVDLRVDMIKQDLENEKEALDKKLDYLQDFYQKQKDLLQDAYDEDKYLEEQTEKRKAVTDIEFELAQLEYDNSAWAQKRKLELLDELTSAKKELTDFEKEHALQSAQEELDAQLALHEKEIEAEQLLIDEKLNNAKALYEQALADVRNGSVALYEEMIAYNAKYGSGIDEDIKKAWETAYVALEDYFDLYDERYKGIKLDNATEYEKPKTETPKDKASESTKDKSASESKKDTSSKDSSNDKKKKNTPSLAKGSSITVKKSATHFGSKSGGKKMASFVPGGKYTVYKTSGNQVLIGKNGEYTGWIKKSDIVGYKSGTDYSIAGLAQFDEEGKGSEYIFESTNGNRYRMFGEGSKVLNADATNFLYDFATSGGSVLAKMFSDAFNAVNLNNITKPAQTIQLAAGDIIIQGNASQRTVSEIRRAQRENLEFVLKSLNSLNK